MESKLRWTCTTSSCLGSHFDEWGQIQQASVTGGRATGLIVVQPDPIESAASELGTTQLGSPETLGTISRHTRNPHLPVELTHEIIAPTTARNLMACVRAKQESVALH
ncbi:Hypothetical predicted protein [Podarcis lilfordi]|uniref:Uncharacterized protein n=1 Tax=Podarcis lilfordi TaxID=74358 RepID=A0AA35KEP2_9SAUR|nr:Hypothetical predicted protein [Podarcis lilfordi]